VNDKAFTSIQSIGERLMDKRITSANTFIDQPQGKENSTDENSSVL
jgi:hypothetical protein